MSQANPYAPPLAPYVEPEADAVAVTPWFAVSTTKLALLSVATLGFYSVYWFYKQWATIKRTTGLQIWPVPRAIFSVFFVHDLFRRVRAATLENDLPVTGDPNGRATFYVVMTILGNLASRFNPIVGFSYLFSIIPVVATQREINALLERAAPDHDHNANYTALNIVGLLLGAGMWFLIVLGLFLGEADLG